MVYRIAIVGLGKIAQDQHQPSIAKDKDFKLVAAVDPRGVKAAVPVFQTLNELIESGVQVDAVSICTPPGPRFDTGKAALDAGFNVLIEKPPFPTMGEFTALAEHAAARRRILFTAWHSQYNAAVDEAKRQLSGRTVVRLKVNWKEDVRHWHPGQEWIWEPGGFGVMDPGINAFSIVTKIMPSPVFVAECTLETPRNRSTPIAAQIRFKPSWSGEADLSAELDWRQTGEQSWNIDVETRDGLSLQLRKGGTELHVNGKRTVAEPSEEYEAIYRQFSELLGSGASHVDGAPLQLVADCFMLGRRTDTEAFHWHVSA